MAWSFLIGVKEFSVHLGNDVLGMTFEEMRIGERLVDFDMPKALRDVAQAAATHRDIAGKRMAQVVEMEVDKLRLPTGRAPMLLDLHRLQPIRPSEDPGDA